VTTSPPAIVFVNASVGYGGRAVVERMCGAVPVGEALALVGPNGGGKSTVIKSLLGLLPVVRGEIRVMGRRPQDARPFVGYVPQAGSLDPEFPISVAQVVLLGRYRRIGWFRAPGGADRAASAAALSAVGLAELARHRFGTLSGGQQQRVLLARAIVAEPRILLLDEPFNGVDRVSQDAMLGVLAGMKARGTTMVISTHDLSIARHLGDQACLLNRRPYGFGPVATTLTEHRLRDTYDWQGFGHRDQVVLTGTESRQP
jgi:manganese/iron transport system ATP-binding protein